MRIFLQTDAHLPSNGSASVFKWMLIYFYAEAHLFFLLA
jgi:hypothetical protein